MQHHKPAWWQLLLLAPIMFGLLALEHVFPLPGISDGDVDAGIVIFTFIAMLIWVNGNAGRLEWYYADKDRAFDEYTITVYEPISKAEDAATQPENTVPALKANGNGKTTSNSVAVALSHRPARLFRPRSSVRKEKNKWFHS